LGIQRQTFYYIEYIIKDCEYQESDVKHYLFLKLELELNLVQANK